MLTIPSTLGLEMHGGYAHAHACIPCPNNITNNNAPSAFTVAASSLVDLLAAREQR